jgi:hypothetical protein
MSVTACTEDQLVVQLAIGLFAELNWQTVSALEEFFGRSRGDETHFSPAESQSLLTSSPTICLSEPDTDSTPQPGPAQEPRSVASVCDRPLHLAFDGAHRDAATRFRGEKRVKMSGNSLPERGGEGDAVLVQRAAQSLASGLNSLPAHS